jgi:RNA polymerase sigma-70 factor (ECF subfamily)
VENELIWKNIKKGDVKSLKQLHVRYFYQMCLFAQKTINDNQLVENIVSDCFIKLWENRGKIEIETSIKSYLYAILRNKIIDHFRGNRQKTLLLEELPDIPDETEFDEQQRFAKLYMAISQLPKQRKIILELAAFDSLTYQQIAEKLGISKNTVKTQIARAYRFLKESLEPRDFFLFSFF